MALAQPKHAEAPPFLVWMRMVHDDWAVPGYTRLEHNSHALTDLIGGMCASEATEARLQAARQAWLDTILTWRTLEAFQFGPTLERRSSKIIDFWPARPKAIEQAAVVTFDAPMEGPDALEAMRRWGAATKGLPALEWFLFAEAGQPAPIARSPQLCRYAHRVSRELLEHAQELLASWREAAERWRSAEPPDLQRARHVVLNLMVGNAELLRGRKLEKAATAQKLYKESRRGPSWEAFDSVRSHNTQRFLLAHAEAAAQLMLGRTAGLDYTKAGPRWGLDDVLTAENPPFGRATGAALLASLKSVHQALAALPPDAQNWMPDTVAPAARSLAKLRTVIDPGIAKAWKVTIEFTDADGD